MEDTLTVDQAAAILGYHPDHVRRLLRRGIMRGRQFSKVWMIDRAEVERIKAQQGPGGRLPSTEPKQKAE